VTEQAGRLTFRPMDEAGARVVLAWHYPAPYGIYNTPPEQVDDDVKVLTDPVNHYYLIDEGEAKVPVAYCCYGADAQVRGGDYSADALDVGLGVRPDLTGQRRGDEFVAAVLEHGRRVFDPAVWRVTIAHFNVRAQRVWEKAGFRHVQEFERQMDGMPFVVLAQIAGNPTGMAKEL
jgi:[ribosomal protein S18]-alanine N-acetyltransferase